MLITVQNIRKINYQAKQIYLFFCMMMMAHMLYEYTFTSKDGGKAF